MEKSNNREKINLTLSEGHIKLLGLMFLFFLLTSTKKATNKFSLTELNDIELEKKCRLLNRIKGYMNKEEQYIVHRAEVILQILSKVKLLTESPQLHSAEVAYHSLSLEERKRNMLLDLSKHMQGDHREIIHTVIDLDMKTRNIEKKLRELGELSQSGMNLQSVEKFIDIVEPLLEGEMKDKTKDIKKITSVFKVIKSLDEKGTLNEEDLIHVISPYIEPQQRDSLMKMMQIAKAVSGSLNNPPSNEKAASSPEEEKKLEGSLSEEEDSKEEENKVIDS
ncbi:hypothetical protein CACET_c14420 [Clostridium aceticum]|uniref:Uncharacterized protein n=1 Tax=Clostridium aceticum TaxID=84022 RepID=A0A0D8ICM4_9CLOT|nr:hypothetical protein [Clostridium aceticum]AKL94906.1 hypothetical protein CACET_c14420 [Clostridium aceticum]KJF27829.1 hypothetical protein TZ02_04315 [Clostridium aceticum]